MKTTISSLLILLCAGCASTAAIKPRLDYSVQDKYLKHLSPVFLPLSPEELESPWGREYQIGLAFAKTLDLYQAFT